MQLIEMTDSFDDLAILTATSDAWQLLYQDEHLLVVNKPARLLTVPGRHPANRDCLLSRVQLEFPGASVVHRLDYDTSGLVILPLTKKALSAISIQFQQRQTKKLYQAVVAGELSQTQGQVNAALAPDPDNRPLYKIDPNGKASQTYYRVLKTLPEQQASLVELEPVTGRSHQLRLHMKALGHVILGDPFYAPMELQNKTSRLMLHAWSLSFTHPVTEKAVTFQAEPDFFSAFTASVSP